MKDDLGTYAVEDGLDKIQALLTAKKELGGTASLKEVFEHLRNKNVKKLDK